MCRQPETSYEKTDDIETNVNQNETTLLPPTANQWKMTDYEQGQLDIIYQTKEKTNWEPDRNIESAKDNSTDKPERIKLNYQEDKYKDDLTENATMQNIAMVKADFMI